MDTTTSAALTAFVAAAQSIIDAHFAAHLKNLTADKLTVEPGRKYAKIVRSYSTGGGRSVFCFVDMTNGNVLKAETWKKPAKHARGNIFTPDNGASAVTEYGAHYMR